MEILVHVLNYFLNFQIPSIFLFLFIISVFNNEMKKTSKKRRLLFFLL